MLHIQVYQAILCQNNNFIAQFHLYGRLYRFLMLPPPSSDLRTLPTSSWNRLMAKNYHFCHRLGRDILYRWKMSHQTPCSMWWLVDSFPIGKQTKFVSFWFGLFRSILRSTFCHVVSAPVIRWYSPVHLKLLSCRPLSLTSYVSPTKVSFSSNWELAWKEPKGDNTITEKWVIWKWSTLGILGLAVLQNATFCSFLTWQKNRQQTLRQYRFWGLWAYFREISLLGGLC